MPCSGSPWSVARTRARRSRTPPWPRTRPPTPPGCPPTSRRPPAPSAAPDPDRPAGVRPRLRGAVAGLGDATGDRRQGIGVGIVRAVLPLSEAAGLDVVAEGVETEAQRACLLSLGCRSAQGHLFSRPVPAAEATALLVSGALLPG
ncbi:hypothetical protein GCM10028783_35520 [Modestobacter muralis]